MRSPPRPAIALAIPISLALALALAVLSADRGRAHAQRAPVGSGADDFAIERVESRASVFYQDGLGWQSQASPVRHAPGSQEAWIVQPILGMRVRTGPDVWHDVTLPIDIVSAASPDALDAVSSASRDNESFTLDIYSHVRDGVDGTWTVHWGGHVEETFRSAWLGAGVSRELADDNAVLSASFDVIFDWLDPVWPNGYDPKAVARWTSSLNASYAQLLSPTTVVQLAYGFTAQMGELATTWNSIPLEGRDRIQERLPRTRARHAGTVTLRQAIPDSRTYGLASYRLYVDDFGVLAHTAELQVTQYLADPVWVRASYRFHDQGAASFYTELYPASAPTWLPRTADSDLGAFSAHEVGASVRWFYEGDPENGALRASWLELAYTHYERTDGLHVEVAGLGWGHAL